MSCPRCDDPSAVVESGPTESLVACTPCGTFVLSHAFLEEWRQLSDDHRAVALVLARDHIKILQLFGTPPLIETDDLLAWRRRDF